MNGPYSDTLHSFFGRAVTEKVTALFVYGRSFLYPHFTLPNDAGFEYRVGKIYLRKALLFLPVFLYLASN